MACLAISKNNGGFVVRYTITGKIDIWQLPCLVTTLVILYEAALSSAASFQSL